MEYAPIARAMAQANLKEAARLKNKRKSLKKTLTKIRATHRVGGGGNWGILPWAPGGPMKGPLNTCLKDRYTLIEQSDLNTLIEQPQYSSVANL